MSLMKLDLLLELGPLRERKFLTLALCAELRSPFPARPTDPIAITDFLATR